MDFGKRDILFFQMSLIAQSTQKGNPFMADILRFADYLGPAKIVQVYEPTIDLKAVLVIDNIAMGPAIGGIRMATDVTIEECIRLARTMTLKNAAAGLPHGGARWWSTPMPSCPSLRRKRLIGPWPAPCGISMNTSWGRHGDRRREHGLDQR